MSFASASGEQRETAAGRLGLEMSVTYGGLGYLLGGLGSCLVLLSRDLGIPRGALSWLSAGFGVALLLVGAVGQRVLRIEPGRVLRAGCGGLAIGAALLAVAPSVLPAQLGALLIGLGGAAVVLSAPALLIGPGAEAQLTRVNAVSSLAGVSAPVLLGALDGAIGRGRLALIFPVPAMLFLAIYGQAKAVTDTLAVEPAPSSPPGRIDVAVRCLAVVAAVCPEFAFVVWAASRIQDAGLGPAGAATAAAAFPIGMGIGRLFGPRFVSGGRAIATGVSLGVAGTLLVVAPLAPLLVASGVALAGLGIAMLYPLTLTRLVQTPGLGLQRGSALAAMASGAAVLGAPLALDWLARGVGLRSAFLAAVPSMLLVAGAQRLGARRAGEARD